MKTARVCLTLAIAAAQIFFPAFGAFAQGSPPPDEAAAQTQPDASPANQFDKPVQAIGYRIGGGATKITLIATGATPEAHGEAKVEAKTGATTIEADVAGLTPPTKFGAEFLTYVLWAVSPEGSTYNLGEIRINSAGEGKLKTSTQLQAFSLFVAAEPYFSVRQPSEVLVLENEISKNTKGEVLLVHEYKLMARAQYEQLGNPLALSLDLKHVPLEMYEARNAAEIARSRGADQYAADIYAKVDESLKKAEDALARKAGNQEIVSAARQAVQFAEDARALTTQRREEERIAQEREAAAAQAKAEAEAKAAAEAAEAKRKADEEAQRQAELAAAREAKIKAEAELASVKAKMEADAQAAQAKAEADALAQAKAEAEALAATTKADAEALAARTKAEAEALLATRFKTTRAPVVEEKKVSKPWTEDVPTTNKALPDPFMDPGLPPEGSFGPSGRPAWVAPVVGAVILLVVLAAWVLLRH